MTTLLFMAALGTGKAQEKNLVGQKAEDLLVSEWINTAADLNHLPEQLRIDSLKGKVIVLDFWFVRCAPCVAAIPHLNKLSELYPEIVFLSISFDQKEEMNVFLDKMLLNYPVGLDSSLTTINKYEVDLFPRTFVIDTNGVIQWEGSPFHLKVDSLNKMLNVERKSTLSVNSVEGGGLPDDILEFTYKVHDLEMGESAYAHDNPDEVEMLNQSLENILVRTFEINNARIIQSDTGMLQTPYDISLKLSNKEAKEGEASEKLKYLLPDALGFDFIALEVDTVLYEIVVEDSSKLAESKSSQTWFGAHWNKKKWKGEGVKLSSLVNFLENEYHLLAQTEVKSDLRYDFKLPMNDFEKLQEVLAKDYGLQLNEVRDETTLFQVVAKE